MSVREIRRKGAAPGLLAAAITAALLCAPAVAADAVRWRDDAPARYTVKKGDTLWDISGQFLHSPWRWPRVWQKNPQIDNPHLIYPGDVLTLRDCDGEPCIGLERGQDVVRMAPEMRELPRREVVPPLPMSVLATFMREHRVVDSQAALDELAYVIGGDNKRLISGAGDQVFVRLTEGTDAAALEPGRGLGVFRPGEVYYANADDDTPIGLELIGIGEGTVVSRSDDVARVNVTHAAQEVRNNDIILPLEPPLMADDLVPSVPRHDVSGSIISVPGGVRFIGRLQVVAIDLGTEDGIQPGHVLTIKQQGERVVDPRTETLVQLPGEDAGTLVVFRPYDRVSYAIVMEATNTLSVGDTLHPPR